MRDDSTPKQSSSTDADKLYSYAQYLISVAKEMNLVVTIELQPKTPLAMGHYEMVADVRPAREAA